MEMPCTAEFPDNGIGTDIAVGMDAHADLAVGKLPDRSGDPHTFDAFHEAVDPFKRRILDPGSLQIRLRDDPRQDPAVVLRTDVFYG